MKSDDLKSFKIPKLLFSVWKQLAFKRQRMIIGLLMLMLVCAGVELISLGTTLPFLAALANPEQLWSHNQVQTLARALGFNSASQLLFPITILFITVVIVSALLRSLNLWLGGRVAAAVGSDLSYKAFSKVLCQPYEIHVRQNSSNVISALTASVANSVVAINSSLQLCSALIVSIAILLGIVLISPFIALAAALLFGFSYALITINARARLKLNGRLIVEDSIKLLKIMQEALGSIRDVLLDGTQSLYAESFRRLDRPQRLLTADNNFISASPRYILEALGIVFIAGLGFVLVTRSDSFGNVITILGTLALGAQKLLPSLQQVYAAWADINGYQEDLVKVLDILDLPSPQQAEIKSREKLVFRKSITFESVSFQYTNELPLVNARLDFTLYRGQSIGIIGSTGSGKSTMLDMLMGLLKPTTGRILIDDQDLHLAKNNILNKWRASIAHVPQSIYLTDTSIAENIAFGVAFDKIDFDLVRFAARSAQIADFIESMTDGYRNYVGERGVRLSGGQRQRIGIARALYRKASVLVFDEATSALDNETEKAVMSSVVAMNNHVTLIMIAHRLSTLSNCDRVLRLEKGTIVSDDKPSVVFDLN